MKREEPENKDREDAQQQDPVRPVRKDGKNQEADRRRFLKTGAALAAGGAAAYVAPSVARGGAGGGVSPVPLPLPLFQHQDIPNGGVDITFQGPFSATYHLTGSHDFAIDESGNASITKANWIGQYISGVDDLGQLTVVLASATGTYVGTALELELELESTFPDNPERNFSLTVRSVGTATTGSYQWNATMLCCGKQTAVGGDKNNQAGCSISA